MVVPGKFSRYVTAGGAGKDLYGFGPGMRGSYEGDVHDHDHIVSFHWTKLRCPDPDTVEWSRVRCTGFSFLVVEAEAGTSAESPKPKVSAPAESGERVDYFYFEIRRGRRPAASVAGGAAVVAAVERALEGGGGLLAVGLVRTGGVADAAGGLGHGDRLLEIRMISGRRNGRGADAAGVTCMGHGLTTAVR